MWTSSKGFVHRVVELLKVRRVDFPSKHPSHVDKARLLLGSILSWRCFNIVQERCPSQACSVSTGITVLVEWIDGAALWRDSQYCWPVRAPCAHTSPSFVRMACEPLNVMEIPFSPSLHIEMKHPAMSGEWSTSRNRIFFSCHVPALW
jgi:hypothetical protein